ncbi:MAG: hypothetical protein QOG91_407, partial [Candidatus Parcubacteria bacterium]|nr:hypothetical protein [Candidatus Parcubacteria bacterium]
PHLSLPDGRHTDGYFRPEIALADTSDSVTCEHAASDLVELLRGADFILSIVDRIAGPTRAIRFLGSVRRRISWLRGFDCPAAYASPITKSTDGGSDQFFTGAVEAEDRVTCCDTYVATGKLMTDLIVGCQVLGARVQDMIPVLVNLSGKRMLLEREIVALIECPIEIWPPDECRLCNLGSKTLPLGSEDDWKSLIGKNITSAQAA